MSRPKRNVDKHMLARIAPNISFLMPNICFDAALSLSNPDVIDQLVAHTDT